MRVASIRWGTLLPNLGTLGLFLVLELFAVYATEEKKDRQMDRRLTKATLTAPSLRSGT